MWLGEKDKSQISLNCHNIKCLSVTVSQNFMISGYSQKSFKSRQSIRKSALLKFPAISQQKSYNDVS